MLNDTPDLLKIIAGETGRLSPRDREILASAAAELDLSNQQAYLANVALIECRQQIIALNDRIIQLNAEIAKLRSMNAQAVLPSPQWSMSSGWVECRGYMP